MVKVIENDSELEKMIQDKKLTVVDFFATWCGPCNFIAPGIKKMAESYNGVNFVKIDVDKKSTSQSCRKYKISAMPTLKFFKDGKEVAEVVGADLKKIEGKVKELM